MKKESRKYFILAACFLLAFVLWTIAICLIDVRAIGPRNTAVGLATINSAVHRFFGVHMALYTITDWLGLVPIAVMFCFAVLGLIQWIRRKKIRKVDYSILALGGFYIVTFAFYVLFEYVVINRRPVLIDGYLEASYPSSTTMLALCVIPTAMIQFRQHIANKLLRRMILALLAIFTIFMVISRLLSGVHWLSDIVGGILLSAGLVLSYIAVCKLR